MLTGSRAEPEPETDELSDFDVILFLGAEADLSQREDWLGEFGSILVMLKERVEYLGQSVPTRLVQYDNGLRIDFALAPVDILQRLGGARDLPDWLDGGYRFLLDKDGWEERLPRPSGFAYVPKPPTESEYRALVEEFWWESIYVAKYLKRGELLPAKYSGECVLRFKCLVKMLEWYVQIDRGWRSSVGPHGRGLHGLLSPGDRRALQETFAGADADENWAALFKATALFRRAAKAVAADLGYEYSEAVDHGVDGYLREIRPGGAS